MNIHLNRGYRLSPDELYVKLCSKVSHTFERSWVRMSYIVFIPGPLPPKYHGGKGGVRERDRKRRGDLPILVDHWNFMATYTSKFLLWLSSPWEVGVKGYHTTACSYLLIF